MAWYLLVIALGLWYVKSPKFRAVAHVTGIIFFVVGIALLDRTGYFGPFFSALFAVPVDFVVGLGGLVYHLLLG